MTDRRDFDPNLDMDRRKAGMAPDTWAWIAGVAFMFGLLGLILFSGMSTQTARNDVNPPATTGQAR
jgi:hypothetical protein